MADRDAENMVTQSSGVALDRSSRARGAADPSLLHGLKCNPSTPTGGNVFVSFKHFSAMID